MDENLNGGRDRLADPKQGYVSVSLRSKSCKTMA